jgi:alpha-amylase
MEKWSLPADAQKDLTTLEEELGPKHLAASSSFVRGGHWHHFLVKYSESNRMHKTMVALSNLARSRGDPPAARRAVGRAQCNDAYWHGVFGGLYLPHLRNAIWRQLAIAEQELRRGESLACDQLDLDYDGYPELWVHSSQFSALISPHRGGAVEMLTRFSDLTNLADVLTRRRESYHELPKQEAQGGGGESKGSGTASIHDIEKGARLAALPPVDAEPRAMLLERVLAGDLSADDYANAKYTALRSWAAVPMTAKVSVAAAAVTIVLQGPDLEKRLKFDAAGCLEVAYRWNAAVQANAVFAPELSVVRDVSIRLKPETDVWRSNITTVARSERGFEETVQGIAITPRWPAQLGRGELEIAT